MRHSSPFSCLSRFLRLNSRLRYFHSSHSRNLLCVRAVWALALCIVVAAAAFFVLNETVDFLGKGVMENRREFEMMEGEGRRTVHVHNSNQIR